MDDYEAYEDHLRYEQEFPDNQNRGRDNFFGMSDTTFVKTFRFCKEEVSWGKAITPKAHYSQGPLLPRPITPKAQYSHKMGVMGPGSNGPRE